MLEFICLSVVFIISVNAYASRIFLLVCLVVALGLFVVFNIFRVRYQNSVLRLLFYIPLVIAYFPFFFNYSLTP